MQITLSEFSVIYVYKSMLVIVIIDYLFTYYLLCCSQVKQLRVEVKKKSVDTIITITRSRSTLDRQHTPAQTCLFSISCKISPKSLV